ncbi:sulfatase family protein [Paraglaciecola arctica]|uniref:Arylsulfatase B n=1 Tax=Paraglaciecola arctica BSs20135 TaxID=493475 RepID=K6Y3Z1_9ALTE|nr:sulfatase [Paraglaciecola arctica]GAC18681.1 arylsulfatase B [Paraglaciecola arctica BSs20135]
MREINISIIVVFVVSLFLVSCENDSSVTSKITSAVPPNIVIILADDMGFGDLSINGSGKIKTPAIDQLARTGFNFTQFYASANICSPSRAGLMTGRYPIRTSLGYNVITAGDTHGLPKTEDTLAELALRADYRTMLIGKWHLGRFPEHAPMKHGFETFYGVPHSNDMANFALYSGDNIVEQPVEQSTLTLRYTEKSVSFIDANAKHPFLLFVSHTMPHIPLYASEDFAGKSDAGVYGDVVEELDYSTGKIVAALKRNGIFDNSIIIITSDNGPFFEGATAGLKGGKGSTYEGAYRVPLIISWPAGIANPAVTDAIAMNIDILPTIAEAIESKPAASIIDGRSLLPLLRGAEKSPHEYLYYFNNEDVVGIRNQQWKYLTHTYYRRSIGALEKFDQLDGFKTSYDLLFAANNSGGEEYSMAARQPEIVALLKAEISRARAEFDVHRTRPKDKTFPE